MSPVTKRSHDGTRMLSRSRACGFHLRPGAS